ncbi:MAG: carboxypeptidase regulatory-like domain-containing protein [Flammeovirgaceae bacterium]|nr:carboxypeptidase regulatory-like domain-containing protein [Flammeovirgaceae bacterium]
MIKKIIRLCSVTLSILFFIVSSDALGQVSGILVDEQSGKPISKASIFINNTSLAVLTNDKGEFALDGIAPGFVELVIYRDGYKLFKSSIPFRLIKHSN